MWNLFSVHSVRFFSYLFSVRSCKHIFQSFCLPLSILMCGALFSRAALAQLYCDWGHSYTFLTLNRAKEHIYIHISESYISTEKKKLDFNANLNLLLNKKLQTKEKNGLKFPRITLIIVEAFNGYFNFHSLTKERKNSQEKIKLNTIK